MNVSRRVASISQAFVPERGSYRGRFSVPILLMTTMYNRAKAVRRRTQHDAESGRARRVSGRPNGRPRRVDGGHSRGNAGSARRDACGLPGAPVGDESPLRSNGSEIHVARRDVRGASSRTARCCPAGRTPATFVSLVRRSQSGGLKASGYRLRLPTRRPKGLLRLPATS